MKRRIFLACLFYCFFFRLQIYEAIAAIFWQSASYVFIYELTSEKSISFSFTSELLLFGDYILIKFDSTEGSLLHDLSNKFGITLSNSEEPTRIENRILNLIDRCPSIKNQKQKTHVYPANSYEQFNFPFYISFSNKRSQIYKNEQKETLSINVFFSDLATQNRSAYCQCKNE